MWVSSSSASQREFRSLTDYCFCWVLFWPPSFPLCMLLLSLFFTLFFLLLFIQRKQRHRFAPAVLKSKPVCLIVSNHSFDGSVYLVNITYHTLTGHGTDHITFTLTFRPEDLSVGLFSQLFLGPPPSLKPYLPTFLIGQSESIICPDHCQHWWYRYWKAQMRCKHLSICDVQANTLSVCDLTSPEIPLRSEYFYAHF